HLVAQLHARTVGVLPLFHVRSRLFGSTLVSTPNAVYGGPIGDDAEARIALTTAATRLARDLKVGHLELRNQADVDNGDVEHWHGQDLYVTFRHPIQPNEDAVFGTLHRD